MAEGPASRGPLVAVLAAGRGTRFGGGKLDAACAGRPLGAWVLNAVERAGLAPGPIVTAPAGCEFARQAGWRILVNPEPGRGLGSSLALAGTFARDAAAPALLVLLADMPLIAPDWLARLASARAPAAARYPSGQAGVPALFDRSLFDRLATLSGDKGAAAMLAVCPDLTLLDCDPEMLADVDSAGDLRAVEAILQQRSSVRSIGKGG